MDEVQPIVDKLLAAISQAESTKISDKAVIDFIVSYSIVRRAIEDHEICCIGRH